MEDKQLLDEINRLNDDLRNEHDERKVNEYIDRFMPLWREAKLKWPNVGRLGIIPVPRKVGDAEPDSTRATMMGRLKSAVGQLVIMANRKAA